MSQTLDIVEARKRATDRRAREIAQAESRYAEVIRHIDGLVELFDENAPEQKKEDSLHNGKYKRWPGFRKAVWEAAKNAPAHFSANHLITFMQSNYPSHKFRHANIASELWRLRKLLQISLVERGVSRKPNVYAIGSSVELGHKEKKQE
jgi:hypothetical protein